MTSAEFKTYFPEFNTTEDAQIDRAIELSEHNMSESVYGDKYEICQKYLVAHLVSINSGQFDGSSNATKSISSKGVDGVSVSYGDGNPSDYLFGMLNSTSYGQMFVSLSQGLGNGGFSC